MNSETQPDAQGFIDPPYFVATTRKLLLMYVATLGLYQLYWFYRQWRIIELREPRQRMVFVRAFFSIFFCYELFSYLHHDGVSVGIKALLTPFLLAVIFILFSLAGVLPMPWPLLGALTTLPVCYVDALAHRINFKRDGNFRADQALQPAHFLLLALAIPLWLSMIIAIFKGTLVI